MAGGSSGQGMGEAQGDVSALILRGTNQAGTSNWSDADSDDYAELQADDYDTEPNVLNYLLNVGLDEAGGNVFDGVSAYDPSLDLSSTDTALTSFETDITALDDDGNIETFFDAAYAKAWTADTTDVESLFTTAAAKVLAHATQVLTQGHTYAKTNARDILDALVDDATTYATELMADVDPQVSAAIITAADNANISVSKVLQTALSTALESALGDFVSNAVAAHRARALKTHMRSVNRFTAGMADINAVNSSAFVLGMALLESDFELSMNEYDAQLSIDLYKTAFQQFMDTFRELVAQQTGLYKGQYDVLADLSKSLAALGFEAHGQNMQIHATAADAGVHNYHDRSVRTSVSESALDADIAKTISALLVSNMQAVQGLRMAMSRQAAGLRYDYNRARTVAYVDQYDRDLEIDAKTVLWDMELFQMTGNIVGAVTGSVIPSAGKPSKTASTLAGMASGAAQGASLVEGAAAAGLTASGPVGWGLMAAGGLAGAIGGFSS